MKRQISGLFLVFWVGILVVSCATVSGTVSKTFAPLPGNIIVIPPDPSSPFAVFSGTWNGYFDGVIPHTLVVKEINSSKVKVVYAVGEARNAGQQNSAWYEIENAEFQNGELFVPIVKEAYATYKFKGGKLYGIFKSNSRTASAELVKQE